jgi:oligoendopeptidase F
MGTFFHQVLYARFELEIHKIVEEGGALSPETMSELWEKFTRQYYGQSMTLDEQAKFKWSRIPHFYNMYYVFQYATSYAASQAILAKFLAGDSGIIEKYLAMLSNGGANYPVEQLKMCGIDMSKPEPVLATLKLFSAKVEELNRLTQE